MARLTVLVDLLQQNELDYPNNLLLKKFILVVHAGWFRINGQNPDRNYSLADYLLDDERIVLDYTQLSEGAVERFQHWFLSDHLPDAQSAYLSGVKTTDYRGYTAEVDLSWWGRITNLLFYHKKSYHWTLSPLSLSFNYQLTGMEICPGKKGLVIALNQLQANPNATKYHDPGDGQIEPIRNVKRVVLTDDLIERLLTIEMQSIDFMEIIEMPHPYAVTVLDHEARMNAMLDYRKSQYLISTPSWTHKCLKWVTSCFNAKDDHLSAAQSSQQLPTEPHLLMQYQNARVLLQQETGKVLILEQRPPLDTLVFCGGGAKIYAHVGAYRAFWEAGIIPRELAGSSAGAIMALLCYLGYSPEEILHFFRGFHEEKLVKYDMDRTGISDTTAIKAALDYMIIKKINQIIRRYGIDQTQEGRIFLATMVFHRCEISFESLSALKARVPDCELAEELLVTATKIKTRTTQFFSNSLTPTKEVSAVVTLSATFPIVFKPTVFEGEEYNDGGILNNLPTDPFRDNRSTLLVSEHGNRLSLVALQFENEADKGILTKASKRVYRENMFLNWFYACLTGVKDPVSAWEQDRLKLQKLGNQVIMIPVGTVSATNFDIGPGDQETLLANGYQATRDYIVARYRSCTALENAELMHQSFSSLEEVIYFICYRNREDWFELMAPEAIRHGMDAALIADLRQRHFTRNTSETPINYAEENHPNPYGAASSNECGGVCDTAFSGSGFLLDSLREQMLRSISRQNMQFFEIVYPVLNSLSKALFHEGRDQKLFKHIRHGFSLQNPLKGMEALGEIQGAVHVLFAAFVKILFSNLHDLKCLEQKLTPLLKVLNNPPLGFEDRLFYFQWELLPRHADRITALFYNDQVAHAKYLCQCLKHKAEPLELMGESCSLIEIGNEDENSNECCYGSDGVKFDC